MVRYIRSLILLVVGIVVLMGCCLNTSQEQQINDIVYKENEKNVVKYIDDIESEYLEGIGLYTDFYYDIDCNNTDFNKLTCKYVEILQKNNNIIRISIGEIWGIDEFKNVRDFNSMDELNTYLTINGMETIQL